MKQWVEVASRLHSSYKENDLGMDLYNLVRAQRPFHCVEIGMLYGYSAIHILAALEANGQGKLIGYDLWDRYEFHHCSKVTTLANIHEAGLEHRLRGLVQMDAKHVPLVEGIPPIDFLHIDVSNDGYTYRWAMNVFADKLAPGGVMVLEGGTPERDRIEWMVKFGKEPICPVLEQERPFWTWQVVPKFPGLTIMRLR